jgi:hypothetical protein
MTIKTQGGKVLTKGGKVSCECCGGEPDCCMYPGSGGYSSNNLPDAVTVDGTSFNRSGTSYGDTTNGVILESGAWAKYSNGTRSERPCLIQSGVVDQFSDNYQLSPDFGYPRYGVATITVSRINLCVWRTVIIQGRTAYFWALFYQNSTTGPIFRLTYQIFYFDEDEDDFLIGEVYVWNKQMSQNKPDGYYVDPIDEIEPQNIIEI